MTTTDNNPFAKSKGTSRQFTKDGITFTATVDPCVFMYPKYPLQMGITAEGMGRLTVSDRSVTWETCTNNHIEALCAIHLCACSKCGAPAYDATKHDTNRAGQCEKCFMDEILGEFDKAQKKQNAKDKREAKKMKAKGYTHSVLAWVHPERGGDDYQIMLYTIGAPSPKSIEATLRKRGSRVLNDYSISPLA